MSDEMFKIVPIVGPPQRAAWAEPKEPTAPEPPAESAAPGPPAEPIFEEGRVGIVRNTKRFVTAILTSAVWFFGAVFMLVLLFSGTPYEFREDRGNGHSVARGTSTGSLFSPPGNDSERDTAPARWAVPTRAWGAGRHYRRRAVDPWVAPEEGRPYLASGDDLPGVF